MMPILDKAYKSYAGGDGAKGATLVNDAYHSTTRSSASRRT